MSKNEDGFENKELITLEEEEYYSRMNSSFINGKSRGVEEVLGFINSRAGICFAKGNMDTANVLREIAKQISYLSQNNSLETYADNLAKNNRMLDK